MDLTLADLALADGLHFTEALRNKSVLLGFDGFIDVIVRPIASRATAQGVSYHPTLDAFGQFISSRSGRSASVELETQSERIGGNMPNTAAAFKALGIQITCLGALGYPEVHPLFQAAFTPAEVLSVADPGHCFAFEFEDGKLMCALNQSINDLDWACIQRHVDMAALIQRAAQCDLIALLNWSELPHSQSMWQGMLDQVLTGLRPDQWLFFDLSDGSRKQPAEIREALAFIEQVSRRARVALSLNENEASQVSAALFGATDCSEATGAKLRDALGCEIVVFHQRQATLSFAAHETHRFPNHMVERPNISTGGGDNFNAGFCVGLLAGLSLPQATILGSLCGSYYVEHARCASVEAIASYARELSAKEK